MSILLLYVALVAGLDLDFPKQSPEHTVVKVQAKQATDKTKFVFLVFRAGELIEHHEGKAPGSILFSGPPGQYVVIAVDLTAGEQVQARLEIVAKSPPPNPPPSPPKPPGPTPPPDEFQSLRNTMQAAYGASSESDKATQRDQLAALYRYGASSIDSAADWSAWFKGVTAYRNDQLKLFRTGALMPVQELFKEELVARFPNCRLEGSTFAADDKPRARAFLGAIAEIVAKLQ